MKTSSLTWYDPQGMVFRTFVPAVQLVVKAVDIAVTCSFLYAIASFGAP